MRKSWFCDGLARRNRGTPWRSKNRYVAIIEGIFTSRYRRGTKEVDFDRADIERLAKKLAINLPKNLGNLIYTFRYRAVMPPSIASTAPEGENLDHPARGEGEVSFRPDTGQAADTE